MTCVKTEDKKPMAAIKTITGMLILLLCLNCVSAITASIGNGIMNIKAEVGDTVSRSVLAKNTNNISVAINVTVSGDLKDSTTILNNNFVLEPGSEKNIDFQTKVTKSGTTETKINVKFTGVGETGGSGLSALVRITTGSNNNSSNSGEEDEINNTNKDVWKISIPGGQLPAKYKIGAGITLCTLILFVVVLIIANKKSRQEYDYDKTKNIDNLNRLAKKEEEKLEELDKDGEKPTKPKKRNKNK